LPTAYAEGIYEAFLPCHQQFDSFLLEMKALLKED
jgi:hypothetical protein